MEIENCPQGNIWKKLMLIQKSIKNFENSEDSEKREPGTNRSAYRFTPGWVITEKIREKMDEQNLMLIPEFTTEKVETMEYPVYKMINNTAMTFTKREIHFVVNAKFTWIDTETGEKAGPFPIIASGMNGTDKSCASAIAQAERYFFLKFFHIATRDKEAEPDAHDSETVTGIPHEVAPGIDLNKRGAMAPAPGAAPIPQGSAAANPGSSAQPRQPQFRPQPNPAPTPIKQTVNVFTTPPGYNPPAAQGNGISQFNEANPAIQQAINRLMQFDRGTVTHRQILNECIGMLSSNGIICTEKNFIENLSEAAQAHREGRQPRYV